MGLLASGRASAWGAALAGPGAAATLMAVGPFGMPAGLALAAAGHGAIFAAFRIVWLIVAAVFLYDLAVATGQFDVMKASIARLSGDRRIQAVLVAFSFGAFLEGASGFGAPVAISAAFLVGLGFRPFQAALLCLIANTAPVAWGSIGTPIRTLAGGDRAGHVEALSATSGRILPPLSLILPFWLVRTMAPGGTTLAVWPALLAIGGTFAGDPVCSGPTSSASSWSTSPRRWPAWGRGWPCSGLEAQGRVAVPRGRRGRGCRNSPTDRPIAPPLTVGRVARAWMPFALLTVAVLALGPAAGQAGRWTRRRPGSGRVPGLHDADRPGAGRAHRPPRADPRSDREKAVADIVPVSSTGSAVFVAAVDLGLDPGGSARCRHGGGCSGPGRGPPGPGHRGDRGDAGARVRDQGVGDGRGPRPGIHPDRSLALSGLRDLLGWLGVALTGSDTSSNVLFGNLQRITAEKLGLSPVLMASANTTGGVMGKMIDAQSIVVAATATGEPGNEGPILRAVLGHSLALALLVGAIVWTYAHVLPGLVVEARP